MSAIQRCTRAPRQVDEDAELIGTCVPVTVKIVVVEFLVVVIDLQPGEPVAAEELVVTGPADEVDIALLVAGGEIVSALHPVELGIAELRAAAAGERVSLGGAANLDVAAIAEVNSSVSP